MNKKLFSLINIPSAIAFFVLIARDNTALEKGIIIGFLSGLLIYFLRAINIFPIKKTYLWISAAAGIFICYFGLKQYCSLKEIRNNWVRAVIYRHSLDFTAGLWITGMLLSLASLPFLANVISIILLFAAMLLRAVKKIWTVFKLHFPPVSLLKKTGIVSALILLSGLAGTLLLTAAYSIPTEIMDTNLKESALTIKQEGAYPILFESCTSRLDNYSDSIIMLQAGYDSSGNALVRAMYNTRGELEGMIPVQAFTRHYINGTVFDSTVSYYRYWHGYLIFIKPLMAIMNYGSVRILNGIVQAGLVFAVSFLLIKKGYKEYAIAWLISYCMMMPLAIAKCLHFTSCFNVFTLGSAALLLMNGDARKKYVFAAFLFTGILTSFFDLSTYPATTFGVPLMFWLMLTDSDPAGKKIYSIVRNGLFWAAGYIGMWVTKWLFASVITGENVFADGIEAFLFRTSNLTRKGDSRYYIPQVIGSNYRTFLRTPVTIVVLVFMGFMLICLWNRRDQLSFKKAVNLLFPFLLAGLIPVVWYSFTLNHSGIHVFFANKTCVISLMAVMFGLTCLVRAARVQPGINDPEDPQ